MTQTEIDERARRFRQVLDAHPGETERSWAEKAGLSTSHINKAITGKRQNMGIDFWVSACEAMGVSVAWLAKGVGPMWNKDLQSPSDRYPSRGPIVQGILGVSDPLSACVAELLLAENHHKSDPGPGYWSAKAAALFAELSNR